MENSMTDQEITVRNKQEVKGEETTRPGRHYHPDVDIYETRDSLWLWADMPSVDGKQLSVNLADGILTIEGRVGVDDYKDLEPVYTEYNVGNYLRRFTISSDIDVERIRASVTNGVLELELPKAERAKPRRIAINVG
jgi:HSP20 family protein